MTAATPGPRGDVVGALLAGGRGTRMGGVDKALLELDGRPLVEHAVAALRACVAEVIVVANQPAPYRARGLPVVGDALPGGGPLVGLAAALGAASGRAVLLVACDMPFLTPGTLRLFLEEAPDADVVLGEVGGRPEPLCARYGPACAAPIAARLARGERKMTSFHADVRVAMVAEARLRAVDPHLRFLRNLNTPEELDAARRG